MLQAGDEAPLGLENIYFRFFILQLAVCIARFHLFNMYSPSPRVPICAQTNHPSNHGPLKSPHPQPLGLFDPWAMVQQNDALTRIDISRNSFGDLGQPSLVTLFDSFKHKKNIKVRGCAHARGCVGMGGGGGPVTRGRSPQP